MRTLTHIQSDTGMVTRKRRNENVVMICAQRPARSSALPRISENIKYFCLKPCHLIVKDEKIKSEHFFKLGHLTRLKDSFPLMSINELN